MRKLKSNEIRLLMECARLGLYHLPNGAHPTMKDTIDLIKVKKIFKLNNRSINISVNSDIDRKAQELTAELIELEKLNANLEKVGS